MPQSPWLVLPAVLFALLLMGCGEEPTASTPAPAGEKPAWLLDAAPPDARSIVEAKAAAKEGDVVAVRGRIGGRAEPISAESPVFQLMDLAVPHCGQIPGDTCPTPWDYCCEPRDNLTAHAATVQVVDADGRPIADSPARHGLAPLDEVVVVGTVAPRPDDRVLTIRARGVYRTPHGTETR